MNDDNNTPTPKSSEKIISWLLTGFGIVLLGIGAVGYLVQDPSAPRSEEAQQAQGQGQGKTARTRTPDPEPTVFSSPILLITVGATQASLVEEARKNPSLAPTFLKFVDSSTNFTSAYTAGVTSISGLASILTGTLPSIHQVYWYPWYELNGKKLPEDQMNTSARKLRSLARFVPHFESSGWVSNWLVFKNEEFREGFKNISGTFRANPSKNLLTPVAKPMINDLLKTAKANKASKQFYWIHLDEMESPYSYPAANLKGLLPKGVKGPSDKELINYTYMQNLITDAGKKNPALARALYRGAVKEWDNDLKLLFQGLKDADLYKKMTIILAGSDSVRVGSSEIDVSEESLKVPLIIKMKDQTAPATKTQPVSTMSIVSTIRELGGYRKSPQPMAPSLIPLLKDAAVTTTPILSELYFADTRITAVRDNSIKVECIEHLNAKTLKEDPKYCFLRDKADKRIAWDKMTEAQRKSVLALDGASESAFRRSPDRWAQARRVK